MKINRHLISELSRLICKDRRTIKRYIKRNPDYLCKDIRKTNNPYEYRATNLIKAGYIEKQTIDILLFEGYKLSASNAKHMICKVVKDNNLRTNKYSPVNNSIKPNNSASDEKYTYLKRSYIFNYLWMDARLSEIEKNHLYVNYPKVFKLQKCIMEFRELFKIKTLNYYQGKRMS